MFYKAYDIHTSKIYYQHYGTFALALKGLKAYRQTFGGHRSLTSRTSMGAMGAIENGMVNHC